MRSEPDASSLLGTTLDGLVSLPADPVLRIALYSALGLGVLTLAVMLQVLVLSELSGRRERRRQAFNAAWRPHLALCSLNDAPPEEPLPALRGRRQQLWFLLLWNRTQRQLRGSARMRLNSLFESLNLTPVVLGQLQGRAVHRRLIALSCLRHLGDERHWTAVVPHLPSYNPVVSLATAQALVAIDARRAMAIILPMIGERRDWAMPHLETLCQQAGHEAVTAPLLEALEHSTPETRKRLVPLLAWAQPAQAAPWARQCLGDAAGQHMVKAEKTPDQGTIPYSTRRLRSPRLSAWGSCAIRAIGAYCLMRWAMPRHRSGWLPCRP